MSQISDPAIQHISITLDITASWWKNAKLIPKNSDEILLTEENSLNFMEKATIDDIFKGTTAQGTTIEGFITSKDGSSITLGNAVSIS